MGRDSAANRPFLRSRAHPFHCPAAAMDARTATAATVFVRAQEQHQFQFVFFFAVVIFGSGHAKYRLPTTDGRTGTNRIAKDNDDDEGAFESPAFYRVTALRSAVGRQSANCRRIKNARKRQARPPQSRAEHGSRGSAIAVVHDSGLFGGALNYTSTFSVCPLVRPP